MLFVEIGLFPIFRASSTAALYVSSFGEEDGICGILEDRVLAALVDVRYSFCSSDARDGEAWWKEERGEFHVDIASLPYPQWVVCWLTDTVRI